MEKLKITQVLTPVYVQGNCKVPITQLEKLLNVLHFFVEHCDTIDPKEVSAMRDEFFDGREAVVVQTTAVGVLYNTGEIDASAINGKPIDANNDDYLIIMGEYDLAEFAANNTGDLHLLIPGNYATLCRLYVNLLNCVQLRDQSKLALLQPMSTLPKNEKVLVKIIDSYCLISWAVMLYDGNRYHFYSTNASHLHPGIVGWRTLWPE